MPLRKCSASSLIPGLTLGLCLALSACTQFQQQAPGSLSPLEYYRWLEIAKPSELAAEEARLLTEREKNNNLVDTVHIALLLSLHSADNQTMLAEAEAILESKLNNQSEAPENSQYIIFAKLWLTHLKNQRHLNELKTTNQTLENSLAEKNRENAELQKQLEAFTSIEQQMMQRENSD